MKDSLRADARRFRLSLAASVFLNFGLLVVSGLLDRPADFSRPQGRPHLRMVTFARHPSPSSSARRGIAGPARLAAPRVKQQAIQLPPVPVAKISTRLPQPHPVRTARSSPALTLRIITAVGPSTHIVPHLVIPSSFALPMRPLAPPPFRPPLRLLKPAPAVLASLPKVMPPSPLAESGPSTPRQEASWGKAGDGTGLAEGAGTGNNRKAGGPFGIGDGLEASGITRHIVYVLDTSGSMKSRKDRAEDELVQALHGLHPGETFNIVAFSGGSSLFDSDMAEATPANLQKAASFLSDLEMSGDTDLEDAVVRALMLRDVNEVVVLTDGVSTVGETDPDKLAQALRRLNIRHARISTIGLVGKNADGTDDSFAAAQLLQEIARDSGGTSKLVPLGIATP